MFRAEKVPGAKVVTFANAAETFLEFQNGGVDAVIQDFPVVAYYVAQGGNKGRLVGPKMEAEEYGIAVTKGNKELVAQINKALASLKKSGEFQRIYKKWFGEEN
jgi:glutamine ABC transporter, periplasmic glutamine-binding protein